MTVKFNGGGTLIFPNTFVDLPKTRRFFRETGCLRVIITTLKAPHYQWSLRGLISQDDDQLYQLLGSSNFWTELWFSHWKLFASFMTSEAIAMYSSGSEWIADSRLNSYLNLVELLQIEGIRYLQIHLMFPHFPHHFPTFSIFPQWFPSFSYIFGEPSKDCVRKFGAEALTLPQYFRFLAAHRASEGRTVPPWRGNPQVVNGGFNGKIMIGGWPILYSN